MALPKLAGAEIEVEYTALELVPETTPPQTPVRVPVPPDDVPLKVVDCPAKIMDGLAEQDAVRVEGVGGDGSGSNSSRCLYICFWVFKPTDKYDSSR